MPENVVGSVYIRVLPSLGAFTPALEKGLSQVVRQMTLPGLDDEQLPLKLKHAIQPRGPRGQLLSNVMTDFSGKLAEVPELIDWQKRMAGLGRAAQTTLEQAMQAGVQKAFLRGTGGELDRQLSRAAEGLSKSFSRQLGDAAGVAAGHVQSAFSSPLAKAAADFGGFLGGPIRAAGGLLADGLGAAARGTGSAILGAVQGSVGAIRDTLHGVITGAFQAAALAGGLLLVGGIREAFKGLNLGSQLEGVRNALSQLTGSSDAANKAIQTLQDTALRTGQSFQPLADGAKQLVAIGVSADLAVPALSAIATYVTVFTHGTSTSAQGIQRATLALQEMGLQGTVQAKFLRQLVNDGVPAYRILIEAAKRAGITLGAQDQAFIQASVAQDSLTKSTLSLQTAEQKQADALARYGRNSSQYANATRDVEKAQLGQKDAQLRLSEAMTKADNSHGQLMSALRAGKITAQDFFAALADPTVLAPISAVLDTLNDNLVLSLSKLKQGLSVGTAQLFEPIQKGVAQSVSGIVTPLRELIDSGQLGRLGGQIATFIPVGALKRMGDAVGGMLTKLQTLDLRPALAQLQPFVPVAAAVAGGMAAVSLSFARGLPLIGAVFPALNPLLGVFLGLAVVTPEIRDGLLEAARSFEPIGRVAGPALRSIVAALTRTFSELTTLGLVPLARQLGQGLAAAVQTVTPALVRLFENLVPIGLSLAHAGAVLAESVLPAASKLAAVLLDELGPSLRAVSRGLDEVALAVSPVIRDLGERLSAAAHQIGPALASGLRELGPAVAGLLAAAGDLGGKLVTALAPIAARVLPDLGHLAAIVGGALTEALRRAGPIVDSLGRPGGALPALADAFHSLTDAVGKLLPLLGPLVTDTLRTMADELNIIVPLLAQAARVIDDMVPGLHDLGPASDPLGKVLGTLILIGAGRWFVRAAVIAPIVELVGWVGSLATSLFGGAEAMTAIGAAFQAGGFVAGVEAVTTAFAAAPFALFIAALAVAVGWVILLKLQWEDANNKMQAAVGWHIDLADIFNRVGSAVAGLGSVLGGFYSWLASATEAAWREFASRPAYWITYVQLAMLTWPLLVARALAPTLPVISRWGGDLFSQLGTLASRFLGWLQTTLDPGRAWNAASSWVIGLWNGLVNSVTHIPWGSLGNTIGASITDGIERGLLNRVNQAPAWFRAIFAQIIQAAHDVGLGHSPYMLFAPIGDNALAGIGVGVLRSVGLVTDAMQQAVSGVAADVSVGAAVPSFIGPPTGGLPTRSRAGQADGAKVINVTVNVTQPNATPEQIAAAMGQTLARRGLVPV